MRRLTSIVLLTLAGCGSAELLPVTAHRSPGHAGRRGAGPGQEIDPGAQRTVLEIARAQQGKPYCYGGVGPGCFDCSGLVGMAWYQGAGVTLPRTSAAMARELRQVSLIEIQPGDILHWPGHVGLYAGEGRVIDAGRSGKTVRERRMWGVPTVLRPM